MDIIDSDKAKNSKFSGPFAFLSLPGEIRNQIYTLYFTQDIYDWNLGLAIYNDDLEYELPTYFEILLVSRRIYNEARSMAKYEYTRQLQHRPQLYKIPMCVSDTLEPTQEWELLPCDDRAPRCRNMSAFMKLRLPEIGLYMGNREDERIEERLQKVRTFFVEMVKALQEQGATKSIQVNLPDYDFAEKHWEQLFQVVEPLTQLRETCDILLLAWQPNFVHAFLSYEIPRKWKLQIGTRTAARTRGIKIINFELNLRPYLFDLSRELAKGQKAGISREETIARVWNVTKHSLLSR